MKTTTTKRSHMAAIGQVNYFCLLDISSEKFYEGQAVDIRTADTVYEQVEIVSILNPHTISLKDKERSFRLDFDDIVEINRMERRRKTS